MVQGAFTKANGKLKDKQTCENRNVYRDNLDNFVSVFIFLLMQTKILRKW